MLEKNVSGTLVFPAISGAPAFAMDRNQAYQWWQWNARLPPRN
jgi:hypothetical protein